MKFNIKHLLIGLLGIFLVALVAACTPTTTQYVVTFDSHGGPNVSSQTIDAGGKVSEPNITRSGYTLDGWYEEASYTTEWVFETSTVDKDMTLHAKWSEVAATTYTITFNTDGGSAVANQTRNSGQTFGTLPTPEKAGFTFAGWFVDQNKTQAVVTSSPVTQNVTLYAKWTAITVSYTVTFDGGEADVLPGSRVVASGLVVLPPVTDYLGYELVGWFKEASFTTEWDFETDVVTADITLYAKWEKIPDGTAITSEDQLYNLLNGTTVYEAGAEFYLKYDLDFTGFNWDGALFNETSLLPHTFNLNGNGKKISNLTFTAPNQAGLIPRMSGGSVFGLTLENVHVTGGSQGGILIGRIMNSSTVDISDITIKDSSVVGGAAGAGGLIGHVQGAAGKSTVTVSKVALLNVSVTNNNASTGGLVGDVESSKLVVSDVLVDAVVTTTGERVGGILGEARRNSGNANDLPELFVDNAVVYVNLSGLRYFGAVVGRADNNMTNLDAGIHGATSKVLPGTISDVILIGNYDATHDNPVYGHVGRSNLGEVTNAYAVAFNFNRVALTGINVPEANVFGKVELLPTSAFTGFSELWHTEAGKLPEFANGTKITLGHEVTLNMSETVTQVQYVRNNDAVSEVYFAPESGVLVNWSSDAAGANVVTEVTASMTLYPQFLQLFEVSFETNGGTNVIAQNVLDGQLLQTVAVPTKAGVTFNGWFTDAELTLAFNLTTPITADLTLYASYVDDVAPDVSFITTAGEKQVAAGQAFNVEVHAFDASMIEIRAGFTADVEKVLLTNKEATEAESYYPYQTQAEKDLNLFVVTFDDVLNKLTISIPAAKLSAIGQDQLVDQFKVEFREKSTDEWVSITLDLTFEVVTTSHTVSFETNGGDAIASVEVVEGSFVVLPTPVKSGSIFEGWFMDVEFALEYTNQPITQDTTLYAKWLAYSPVEGSIAISTAQEFFNLSEGVGYALDGNYHLANDIDFTGFTWVTNTTNQTFTGLLDGNFKKLINLNLDYSAVASAKAGIFNIMTAGEIKNITVVNPTVASMNRAGVFAGEVVGSTLVKFTNIVILGGTITGNADNGVGGLAGMFQTNVDVSNISVIGLSVTNTGADNAGAIVGQIDGGSVTPGEVVNISDVFISGLTSKTVDRAGGVFGEIKNAMIVNVNRVVIVASSITNTAGYAGGIGGRLQSNGGLTTVTDAFVNVTISTTTNASSIIGGSASTVSNTYAVETAITGSTSGTQANTMIADGSIIDQAWFVANLNSIASSDLWTYDATLSIFKLKNA